MSEKWRIEANERYRKVVDVVIGLSSAALVLPIAFFRTILGIEINKSIIGYFTWHIKTSWFLLGFSIFCGLIFIHFSAKLAKKHYGGNTIINYNCMERIHDWSYWLMNLSFIGGLFFFIWFVLRF
ncbi:MAG: hypothetical protein NWE89_14395 [Candidatus Bathyarchaeota archaeon]|nr:hypothetical protein [Candidatus Bathyarchaeota archaeon]